MIAARTVVGDLLLARSFRLGWAACAVRGPIRQFGVAQRQLSGYADYMQTPAFADSLARCHGVVTGR